MKPKNALLSLFALFSAVLFLLCSCEGIGNDMPIVTTEAIDTTPTLYDPTASPVELTPEEEIGIIRSFIIYSASSLSEESFKVRCFGAEDGAYAVFVEHVGYTPIEFEDYIENPYDTPMTREHFESSSIEFWYEIGDPLLICKDGEFYRLREALEKQIVSDSFLRDVNALYKAANPGFYDKEW